MKNIIYLLLFLPFFLQAQLIETDPPFPRVDQPVTITFDARLGSGGLAGYPGDIYAHTGVITSESNGPSDWKHVKTNWGQNTPETKLTQVGSEIYQLQITPSIEDYYNIQPGEEVLQLAFVFRSDFPVGGGQYLEGKTENFGDIFAEVYGDNSGLLMKISLPEEKDILVEPGQVVPIKIFTSKNAEISIIEDGAELASESGTNSLEFDFDSPATGTSILEVSAVDGATQLVDTLSITVLKVPTVADLPDGSKLGINYLSGSSIRLVLEAPGKENVIVRGEFSNWKFNTDYLLNKTPDGRYFWIEIEGLNEGEWYTYHYVVDGEIRIADPLSELILHPFHDQFIDESLFPGLPEHPNRAAEDVVTLFRAGGMDYDWQTNDFVPPPKEDLVIYELLIRDFLEDHSYLSLLDTLDYLERLGVNAIELMPVNEFNGNVGWGYDPSFHMALDKYYGSPDHFKAFIDEAHSRGMAVIVDVAFNQATSLSPLAQLYWNASQNRPAANNPWLNETARHPLSVHMDMNHESQSTQDYMDRALTFMLEEYRVDGFRIDLSKGFTQNFTDNLNDWARRDPSRIALLKRLADVVWSVKPDAYVTLEHFADNDEEIELTNYGMMIWGNMHFNFKQASMSYHGNGESDLRGTYHEERGWNEPHLISFMESHDEERIMYENERYGNSQGSYDIKDQSTALDRIELANVFLYSVPGPKLLYQFGELGYDYSINRCTDGTINNNCRLAPKPIRWDYYNQSERRDLFDVTRDMIYLKTRTALNDAEVTSAEWTDPFKFMRLSGAELSALVLTNFSVMERTKTVVFPHTGTWYEYFSGDSITISTPVQSFTFEPGQYQLFLDERILRPSVHGDPVGTIEPVPPSRFGLKLFPNPVQNGEVVKLSFDPLPGKEVSVQLIDHSGQTVLTDTLSSSQAASGLVEYDSDLPTGIYRLVFHAKGERASVGLVVIE